MTSDDSTTRLMKAVAATGLLLVVAWLAAPKFSNWRSHHLADRLVERIAEAEDTQVKVPLRQLADLGETAIEPLVVAAASERAAVATIARQILDEKIAAWKLLDKDASNEAVATLAIALATHLEKFGTTGKLWAERIALTMIELSDRYPAWQTYVLLEHCSRILAAVPPQGPSLRTLATRPEIGDFPARDQFSAPVPKLESLTRSSEGSLEILTRLQPGIRQDTQNRLTLVTPRRHEAGGSDSRPLDWLPRQNSEAHLNPPPFASDPPPKSLSQKTENATPEPTGSADSQVIDIPTPQDMATRADTLRRLSSDELLLRLHEANFYEAGIIRTVLGKRGFSEAEVALRQQLATPNANDRLRLVETVSQLPASTARRLLRWLLDDESGDVRLRALTALATTNAPDLGELARKLAISDQDPRVAKLASRLLRRK
ncbi:MAG: HEAT repeat domain-containing protein [Planctomycetes bacterium]|nr:HEAT repeat domain-containing protein [Planctomycetota bacterium]